MNDLSFRIGDKVVYPNHGVGIIEQISSRNNGATVEKYYLLKIKASSLKSKCCLTRRSPSASCASPKLPPKLRKFWILSLSGRVPILERVVESRKKQSDQRQNQHAAFRPHSAAREPSRPADG